MDFSTSQRDPFRYSILLELDDSSTCSEDSSRCGSPLSCCSYDDRGNNSNIGRNSTLNFRDDDLDESIVKGIRDLDIGTQKENIDQQPRQRSSTFKLPKAALRERINDISPKQHRTLSNSSNSSSDFDSINAFQVPRPASPSLLLGSNPHLRDVYNPEELPTPSSDIHVQLACHESGQYQAILLVPVHDKNYLISDIACEDSLIFRETQDRLSYTLVYGINLVQGPVRNEGMKPGENNLNHGFHGGVQARDGAKQHGFANIITLLATRLNKHDEVLRRYPQLMHRLQTEQVAPYPYSQVFPVPIEHDDQPPSYAEAVPSSVLRPNDYHYYQDSDSNNMPALHSPTMDITAAVESRIEDSVEALDKLDDDIEAIDVQFNRVMTPSNERCSVYVEATTPESKPKVPKSASNRDSKREKYKTISGRPKALATSQQHEMRRASSLSLCKPRENTSTPEDDKTLRRRSATIRPNSLLPPKPLVKSTKPVTQVSNFELPGIAISRRIKEQREARLAAQQERERQQAMQSLVQKTPARVSTPCTPTLHRAKSTKRLTIPNFELPGDALSRRRKQEQEERVRRQEEEERKAREFKARPMPTNIYGSGQQPPRPMVSSKQRQGKPTGSPDPNDSVRFIPKRPSVLPAQGRSTSRPNTPGPRVVSGGGTPRGRNLYHQASTEQLDRATSTSTIGQRSSISIDDINYQRIRGKEIIAQDNQLCRTKEQERKRRELAAKAAREEAAERTRQHSREWAEKQRRKQAAAYAAAT